MPLIKSAIKRARQAKVRHERLVPYKTRMKTAMKKARDAAGSSKEEFAKLLSEAYKAIDTAAKKKIIHRNTADRRKASLAKLVSKK